MTNNSKHNGRDKGEPETETPQEDSTANDAAETEAAEPLGDDWAAALSEQGDTDGSEQAFKELEGTATDADNGTPRELEMVMDIPVKLDVILGKTRLTIKQLLELREGSVVELDGLAGDPLDILINDYLIAQGEVVVVDDKYGIRISEIVHPSERIHKLSQ